MRKTTGGIIITIIGIFFVISYFLGMIPGLFLIAGAVMVIWGPIIWYYGYREKKAQPQLQKSNKAE